ncbi:hypothetical protein CJ030_MR8G027176 [Morella rubra]|uniref:Uncharacterized protein n=1 Tax=Morella rubra TaxID=262757 RepID=A0A6A1UVQ4_9ROSI|nr:hypothetical protein CJ030_MR8G027176 [Morella rubra]
MEPALHSVGPQPNRPTCLDLQSPVVPTLLFTSQNPQTLLSPAVAVASQPPCIQLSSPPNGQPPSPSSPIIKNEDLEELRELRFGTFGTVYHGKWRETDVAIKRIKKSCFTG